MKLIKLLFFLLIFSPPLSLATDLRGRVDISHSYASTPFPAQGINVQLYSINQAGAQVVGNSVTGFDGMYYFYGVAPGNYLIFIQPNWNFNLVVINTRLQDISPILLRY